MTECQAKAAVSKYANWTATLHGMIRTIDGKYTEFFGQRRHSLRLNVGLYAVLAAVP